MLLPRLSPIEASLLISSWASLMVPRGVSRGVSVYLDSTEGYVWLVNLNYATGEAGVTVREKASYGNSSILSITRCWPSFGFTFDSTLREW